MSLIESWWPYQDGNSVSRSWFNNAARTLRAIENTIVKHNEINEQSQQQFVRELRELLLHLTFSSTEE